MLYSTFSQYLSTYTMIEEGNQAAFFSLLTLSFSLHVVCLVSFVLFFIFESNQHKQFQKIMDLLETFYYVQDCADRVKQKKELKPRKKITKEPTGNFIYFIFFHLFLFQLSY